MKDQVLETIGTQLKADGEYEPDAVHVAVAPVVYADAVSLSGGSPVRFAQEDSVEYVGPCSFDDPNYVGVLDPFVPVIRPGDRVWLFLKPGTITGLRHQWSHPAFDKAKVKYVENTLRDGMSESEQYLRDLADSCNLSYRSLLSEIEDVIDGRQDSVCLDVDTPEEAHDSATLVRHYNNVTGRKTPLTHSVPFRCAC